MEVPAGTSKEETEKLALSDQAAKKWLDGKTPRKVIVVPNKIVNIVI
jgi:leucyl-tRNA synthetase